MSTELIQRNPSMLPTAIESALISGDMKNMTPEQRLQFYKAVCDSVGLNHLTRPFEYIVLNGKLTLYARKDATDQLRRTYSVAITILARETVGDAYVVTVRAMTPTGRSDESIGAVVIAGLKGVDLANAMMKAETKAKRRVTLSICGLGVLDETEVDIPKRKLAYVYEEHAPTAALPEASEVSGGPAISVAGGASSSPFSPPGPLSAAGALQKGSQETDAPTAPEYLNQDDVRDIETACSDAGVRMSVVVDKLMRDFGSVEKTPREKKGKILEWIASKQRTA